MIWPNWVNTRLTRLTKLTISYCNDYLWTAKAIAVTSMLSSIVLYNSNWILVFIFTYSLELNGYISHWNFTGDYPKHISLTSAIIVHFNHGSDSNGISTESLPALNGQRNATQAMTYCRSRTALFAIKRRVVLSRVSTEAIQWSLISDQFSTRSEQRRSSVEPCARQSEALTHCHRFVSGPESGVWRS